MQWINELSRVRSLSDGELLSSLSGALCASRRAVAEVVAHLGEVEERRLHLLGGYSSLFAYCVTRLGMSEGEAYRRIEVARLSRRFPSLLEALAAGNISLSVAALLRDHLSGPNHAALLTAVSGKTVAQAREVLAAWFPRPDVLPFIRKLPHRPAVQPTTSPAPASSCEPARPAAAQVPSGSERAPELSPSAAAPLKTPARNIEPLSAERYKLQLTVSAELKRKLELARDLLRHAIPSGELAPLIERAVDTLIERTMKRRFAATARPRKARPPAPPSATPTASAASAHTTDTTGGVAPGRHLSSHVRRTVLARDQASCTWQAPDGTRCNSQAWLEHDHIIPKGLGGTHDPINIRHYCRAHNRLAAEQAYGRDTIARIIAARRVHKHRRSAQPTPVPRDGTISDSPSGPANAPLDARQSPVAREGAPHPGSPAILDGTTLPVPAGSRATRKNLA